MAIFAGLDDPELTRTLANCICRDAAVSGDGRRVATADKDPGTGREIVEAWNLKEGIRVATLNGDPIPVQLRTPIAKGSISGWGTERGPDQERSPRAIARLPEAQARDSSGSVTS